ncbi:Predicted arabinose efflux permease, MFS family [Anaerobium acetethylicum]|uniref:Predicted arabinose efflux permease, MFS family n=2 Tax=Anaerobium acetethylicum TaxID=1619234 RepID=A0A1D3TNN0_9FIRM|nr:Predicted arabinose efflux permease, MFS family [Anaerobium acetethylicum]
MYILFGATVINRFGDFVMPFLAMYLTAKIGLSSEISGIIVTITALICIPSSLLGGKLADEFGRKKTYLIAQGGAALSLLPCAFLKNPVLIVVFLLISTFFTGAVRPPMNAIVTDILPPHQRQQGFSLQYLGINAGVALGPIVAGFLFNHFLPMLFIGDAITSFIACYLVWKNIDEIKPEHLKETAYSKMEKEEKGNTINALMKRPQIAMFLVIYILYSFVYSQNSFSLPLTAAAVFGSAGPGRFGLLMSINACTVLFCTVPVTSLTKHLKPLANMIIVGLLYAVGFGMLGVVHSYYMFILSTVIWTLGEILAVTNFGVYLANNSPSNFRARFNSAGSLSWSFGAALGTSIAGKFIHEIGLNYIWPLTFLISILGSIGMFCIFMIERRKKRVIDDLTDVLPRHQ